MPQCSALPGRFWRQISRWSRRLKIRLTRIACPGQQTAHRMQVVGSMIHNCQQSSNIILESVMNKIFSCSLNERRTKKSAESKRRNLRDGFSLCSSSRCRRSGRSACKRNNSILVRFAQNGSMHARGYQTDRPCARHPRVHRRTPAVFVHRRTPAVFVHAPTACSKRI